MRIFQNFWIHVFFKTVSIAKAVSCHLKDDIIVTIFIGQLDALSLSEYMTKNSLLQWNILLEIFFALYPEAFRTHCLRQMNSCWEFTLWRLLSVSLRCPYIDLKGFANKIFLAKIYWDNRWVASSKLLPRNEKFNLKRNSWNGTQLNSNKFHLFHPNFLQYLWRNNILWRSTSDIFR